MFVFVGGSGFGFSIVQLDLELFLVASLVSSQRNGIFLDDVRDDVYQRSASKNAPVCPSLPARVAAVPHPLFPPPSRAHAGGSAETDGLLSPQCIYIHRTSSFRRILCGCDVFVFYVRSFVNFNFCSLLGAVCIQRSAVLFFLFRWWRAWGQISVHGCRDLAVRTGRSMCPYAYVLFAF